MPHKQPTHTTQSVGKRHTPQRLNPSSSIYHTARWAKIRQIVLNRSPLCADPFGIHKEHNELVPGVDIDHILPIALAPDLTWVVENLQPLCKSCHAKKTRKENKDEDKG